MKVGAGGGKVGKLRTRKEDSTIITSLATVRRGCQVGQYFLTIIYNIVFNRKLFLQFRSLKIVFLKKSIWQPRIETLNFVGQVFRF